MGDDGRVAVGTEGSIGNARVSGGGGIDTGNRGSGRIHSHRPQVRNNAAWYHPCRSRIVTQDHITTKVVFRTPEELSVDIE